MAVNAMSAGMPTSALMNPNTSALTVPASWYTACTARLPGWAACRPTGAPTPAGGPSHSGAPPPPPPPPPSRSRGEGSGLSDAACSGSIGASALGSDGMRGAAPRPPIGAEKVASVDAAAGPAGADAVRTLPTVALAVHCRRCSPRSHAGRNPTRGRKATCQSRRPAPGFGAAATFLASGRGYWRCGLPASVCFGSQGGVIWRVGRAGAGTAMCCILWRSRKPVVGRCLGRVFLHAFSSQSLQRMPIHAPALRARKGAQRTANNGIKQNVAWHGVPRHPCKQTLWSAATNKRANCIECHSSHASKQQWSSIRDQLGIIQAWCDSTHV
eukprot:358080-Chlamydomonas_euryale.AAC.8